MEEERIALLRTLAIILKKIGGDIILTEYDMAAAPPDDQLCIHTWHDSDGRKHIGLSKPVETDDIGGL